MKRIEVRWIDSNCLHGWSQVGKDVMQGETVSCGYLVDQDDKHLVMCLSQGITGQQLCTLSIPNEAIREIKDLRSR